MYCGRVVWWVWSLLRCHCLFSSEKYRCFNYFCWRCWDLLICCTFIIREIWYFFSSVTYKIGSDSQWCFNRYISISFVDAVKASRYDVVLFCFNVSKTTNVPREVFRFSVMLQTVYFDSFLGVQWSLLMQWW